jgi:predicted NBD/HSP70 family sugar kinase
MGQHIGNNRLYNKTQVMKILLRDKNVYCAEVARKTGLSIPTIMRIMEEFMKKGLVFNAGKGASSGGKPPDILQIIPNACFFIGVDISVGLLKCVIINLAGEFMIRVEVPTRGVSFTEGMGELIVNDVIALIQRASSHSGVDARRIMGIGLSLSFPVNTKTGEIIYAPEMGWVDFNLGQRLRSVFRIPVFLENKAKVIAMGAKWFGKIADFASFLLVIFGKGIGSAIVLDGDIYKGENNLSGEMAHMVIKTGGPLCKCGNYGCLEAVASLPAVVKAVKEQIMAGEKTILKDRVENIDNISIDDIFSAAKNKDKLACTAIEEFTANISIGITNVVNILDIGLVLLTGDIINKQPQVVPEIRSGVNDMRRRYLQSSIVVEALQLEPDMAAIGAATLPLNDMVESGVINRYTFPEALSHGTPENRRS